MKNSDKRFSLSWGRGRLRKGQNKSALCRHWNSKRAIWAWRTNDENLAKSRNNYKKKRNNLLEWTLNGGEFFFINSVRPGAAVASKEKLQSLLKRAREVEQVKRAIMKIIFCWYANNYDNFNISRAFYRLELSCSAREKYIQINIRTNGGLTYLDGFEYKWSAKSFEKLRRQRYFSQPSEWRNGSCCGPWRNILLLW